MQIARLELVHVTMPLVVPFASAHSVRSERQLFLVKVTTTDDVVGWGECASEAIAGYSAETLSVSADKLRNEIVPRLNAINSADGASGVMREVEGATFARASVYQAMLDAELRTAGITLAQHLKPWSRAVRPGVVVGLQDNIADSIKLMLQYVDEGYGRIKFKIEPGRDREVLLAVRQALGVGFEVQVDANGAYNRDDFDLLQSLDEFRLRMIEQPLSPDDLEGSAALAALMNTPICLDEGIRDVEDVSRANSLRAGRIFNVKPGRVGGIDEAVRMINFCEAKHLGCWVGGMLETGVGRTANIVLAAMSGCTHHSDVSPSSRYFETDLTEPFVMENGKIEVPNEVGAARAPIDEVLRHYDATTERLI